MTGNDFKQFRESHGLTQTEFADLLGITRTTVYKNEARTNQEIAMPKLYTRALRDLKTELSEVHSDVV